MDYRKPFTVCSDKKPIVIVIKTEKSISCSEYEYRCVCVCVFACLFMLFYKKMTLILSGYNMYIHSLGEKF